MTTTTARLVGDAAGILVDASEVPRKANAQAGPVASLALQRAIVDAAKLKNDANALAIALAQEDERQ